MKPHHSQQNPSAITGGGRTSRESTVRYAEVGVRRLRTLSRRVGKNGQVGHERAPLVERLWPTGHRAAGFARRRAWGVGPRRRARLVGPDRMWMSGPLPSVGAAPPPASPGRSRVSPAVMASRTAPQPAKGPRAGGGPETAAWTPFRSLRGAPGARSASGFPGFQGLGQQDEDLLGQRSPVGHGRRHQSLVEARWDSEAQVADRLLLGFHAHRLAQELVHSKTVLDLFFLKSAGSLKTRPTSAACPPHLRAPATRRPPFPPWTDGHCTGDSDA